MRETNKWVKEGTRIKTKIIVIFTSGRRMEIGRMGLGRGSQKAFSIHINFFIFVT